MGLVKGIAAETQDVRKDLLGRRPSHAILLATLHKRLAHSLDHLGLLLADRFGQSEGLFQFDAAQAVDQS